MAGDAGEDPEAAAPAPRKKIPRELRAILDAQAAPQQPAPRKSHKPSFASTPLRKRAKSTAASPRPQAAEAKAQVSRAPPKRRSASRAQSVGGGTDHGNARERSDGGSTSGGDEDGPSVPAASDTSDSDHDLPTLLCRRDIQEGELRSSWQFASVVHFCNVFREALNLPKGTGADKLEAALLRPEENPVFVARLHLRLLHRNAHRVIEDSEMVVWEDRVRRLWGSTW